MNVRHFRVRGKPRVLSRLYAWRTEERCMAPLARTAALLAMPLVFAQPCYAGMARDLADCGASDRPASASACTRVLESGRLPRSQFYIGYFNRGWSHYNDGDNEAALKDFNRAAKANPSYADTYFSRAVVQQARGERASSLVDLNRYLELKPDDWIVRFNRALLLRKHGEPGLALAELDAAAAAPKSDLQKVTVLRALVLSDTGDNAAARVHAENAIAAEPGGASAYFARALVGFREENLDEALRDAEKAVSLKDDFPAAHTLLGRIAEARGDEAAGKAHYDRAVALPAKSIDARAAREEAQGRLIALERIGAAGAPSDGPAAAARTAEAGAALGGLDCRHYVPAAGTTIAVACGSE